MFIKSLHNCSHVNFPNFEQNTLKFPIPWVWVMFPKYWEKIRGPSLDLYWSLRNLSPIKLTSCENNSQKNIHIPISYPILSYPTLSYPQLKNRKLFYKKKNVTAKFEKQGKCLNDYISHQ